MAANARNAFLERDNFHIAKNPVTKREVSETYAW